MRPRSPGLRRREVLAALGASALGSSAGCMDILSRFAWSGPNGLTLNIATVPANVDTAATQMARGLVENLEAAGINAKYEPQSEGQLLRGVLMEHDFDLFIARHPGVDDPDKLRSLLHTRYSEEAGWQNPFGFNQPAVDDLLERQATQSGDARFETVAELQQRLLQLQPFSVLAYPEQLSVADPTLDLERTPGGLVEAHDYLRLGAANPDIDQLTVGLLAGTLTRNRNPIAVDHHSRTEELDLLYDPLVKPVDGEFVEWLADDVAWVDGEDSTTLRVTLKPSLEWHDGENLTSTDVKFTYEFLQDTAMGSESTPVPAPRFRSKSSVVESASTLSRDRVELTFGDASREVARRALTVPVLPRHVWIERTGLVRDYMTRALVAENRQAVGSGPYRHENASVGNQLLLSRNENHFLYDGRDLDPRYDEFADGGSFGEIRFTVPPQSLVMIGNVRDGAMHISASSIQPEYAAEVENYDDIQLLSGDDGEFYVLGFNARRHPMSNHRFRTAVARMIDRQHAVEEIMAGYAEPSDSPLFATEFLIDEFAWDGQSNLGAFPGEAGEVDENEARDIFRDAGFRYGDNGNLVTQN